MTKPEAVKAFNKLMDRKVITRIVLNEMYIEDWLVHILYYINLPFSLPKIISKDFYNYDEVTRFLEGK